MKFRFCGDGDCPDWVLAEINSTLSMLSAVKLKILTQAVVKSLLGDDIPEEKLRKTFGTADNDDRPMKSAFACIRFLVVNSVRHNADEPTFNEELQQLGLPKEHSTAICRVRTDLHGELVQFLEQSSLKVNELTDISYTIQSEKTIDCATLRIRIADEIVNGRPSQTEHTVNISRSDVSLLLNELRSIDEILGEFEVNENVQPINAAVSASVAEVDH